MQVILLATGETEKLHPLIENIPSPMIPVVNRPIMSYNLELLGRLGFKHILVSLYSQAHRIENFFWSGQRWGLTLEYILQREAWGSAGSLRWAKGLLKETFLVMPADTIIDLEIAQALKQHIDRRAAATVVVCATTEGENRKLHLREDGQIHALGTELNGEQAWVDTGVYIFDPWVIDLIPPRSSFDIHHQLIPALLTSGRTVWGCPLSGYWNPLDTFTLYQEAQRFFLNRAMGEEIPMETSPFRYVHADSRQIEKGIWVDRNTKFHPSAHLDPPVRIGRNCWIGREVELGPDVVIGPNVIIDDEATVRTSTILDYTYVGKLINIENRLVNQDLVLDLETLEKVRVRDPFLLGQAHPRLVADKLNRALNLVLALLLLLLALPFMLVCGFLLLLTTGHVFEPLPRLITPVSSGNQREKTAMFNLLRFNTRQVKGHINWVGAWLERWEGHRLPELFNVLKGDLSMIGVKPLQPEEAVQVHEAWQQSLNFQPGFTGLWYLQTSSDASLNEILVIDTYYAAIQNWREDMRILFQTPAAWFRKAREKSVNRFEVAKGGWNGS